MIFLNLVTCNQRSHIFISGDTNINLLKSNSHESTNNFLNDLASFGFASSITRPTRITEHSTTLIDNIFSNWSHLNKNACIIYDDTSDHLPLLVTSDLKSQITPSMTIQLAIEIFHQKIMTNIFSH